MNVLLPYSFDLPEYIIYMTNNTGAIMDYKENYNVGFQQFYTGYLKEVDIVCDQIFEGALNTACTISFVPNHYLQRYSRIVIKMEGFWVNVNVCTLSVIKNLLKQDITSITTTRDEYNHYFII